MKKYFAAFVACALVTTSFPFLASAKENPLQIQKTKALDDASFEKMIKLNGPNEMQALLSTLRGEWNYSVTVWTEPDAKSEQSTGTSVNEVILGDRFISMKSSGVLNVGGNFMPFEANGLMGYDHIKKVFTSVWIDTLHPGMMVGIGTLDKDNKIIKEAGNFTSSISNTTQNYHSELQFTDSEGYKRTVFSKDKSGKEYKIMEFVYSKKK